jgi:hypothetical protein
VLERDVAPDVAPPTATAAGIVGEEAALAVADGDGAAWRTWGRYLPTTRSRWRRWKTTR